MTKLARVRQILAPDRGVLMLTSLHSLLPSLRSLKSVAFRCLSVAFFCGFFAACGEAPRELSASDLKEGDHVYLNDTQLDESQTSSLKTALFTNVLDAYNVTGAAATAIISQTTLSKYRYYYDSKLGLFGIRGFPSFFSGVLEGLNFSPADLEADSGWGGSEATLNGRRLHSIEVQIVQQLLGREVQEEVLTGGFLADFSGISLVSASGSSTYSFEQISAAAAAIYQNIAASQGQVGQAGSNTWGSSGGANGFYDSVDGCSSFFLPDSSGTGRILSASSAACG